MVELSWLNQRRFEAQSASDLAARSALARLYDNTGELDAVAIGASKAVGLNVYASNFPTGGDLTNQELLFGGVRSGKFQEIAAQDQLREITVSVR